MDSPWPTSATRRPVRPRSRQLGRIYTELLGGVVHDLAVVRMLAGDPERVEFADAWPDGTWESVAVEAVCPGGFGSACAGTTWTDYPGYREVRVHHDRGTVGLTFPSPYLLNAPTVLTVTDRDGDARGSGPTVRPWRRSRRSCSPSTGWSPRARRRPPGSPRAGRHPDLPADRAAAGRRARDRAGRRGGAGMNARPPTPAVLHLVPHTHWDREWYEPFQRFLRLVDMVDGVLDRAEADRRFCFTFDGQTAMLEDYLEIRPEAEARIGALVATGQLAVGPWRILADEFLVSGETLVRNLEAGVARAGGSARSWPSATCPTSSGTPPRSPAPAARRVRARRRLARGAGGGPPRVPPGRPDGSVRAEYLVGGYGNAAGLFAYPDVAAAGRRLLERLAPFFGPTRCWPCTAPTTPLPARAAGGGRGDQPPAGPATESGWPRWPATSSRGRGRRRGAAALAG